MSGANRQSSLKKMLFAIVAVIGCFFCFRDGFFLGNFSLLSMERTLPRLPVRRMAAVKFLSPPQILRRDELLLEEFDGLFTRVLRPDFDRPGMLPTDRYGFPKNSQSQQRDLDQKSPGVQRVFILGGSTVYGWGTGRPEDTISAQLETQLDPIIVQIT